MFHLEKDRVSIKLNTKAAVDKIKFGSPKLKQVLRQKCRERLHEKRNEIFNSRRLGFDNDNEGEILQETLHDIVRKELSNLSTMEIDENINIFDNEPMTEEEALEIEREIIAEQQIWIVDEYERMEENNNMWPIYIEKTMNELQVICPICEKSTLKESPSGLSCRVCQLYLPPTISLDQLAQSLDHHLFLHSKKCRERPSFMAIPENNTIVLYLSCEDCLSFAIIR